MSWDGVLRVLRDPLFALGFSIFLALLAAQAVGRFMRWMLILASIGVFIWLVTRYRSFADVVVAVVGAGAKILVAVICLLAVVAVVAIVSVLVMYLRSEPHPGHRPDVAQPSWRPEEQLTARPIAPGAAADAESVLAWLEESGDRLAELMKRLTGVLERVVDQDDDDSIVRAVGALARIYFSGLSAHMTEIRMIHRACNTEILGLAGELPVYFDGVDKARLTRMARARSVLPDRAEWHALSDDGDLPIPYFVMWLLCRHRRWREVATVLFKCYFSAALVAECIEVA
jgi:hypothetical protein